VAVLVATAAPMVLVRARPMQMLVGDIGLSRRWILPSELTVMQGEMTLGGAGHQFGCLPSAQIWVGRALLST
jgi:hypothetical protein